jgi:tetratricopeptide (TPR) repeat protein
MEARRTSRLRRWAPATLALALCLQATSTAQEQAPIFRAGVDLTRLKVAVVDDDGMPVPGLEIADFRVFENGEEQRLDVMLAPADVPLDLAIVIDFSASVDAEWPDPRPREAAEQFLDALSPTDCVYLLPFQDDVGPGVWGAPNDPAVRRMLWNYPYGWSTRAYDAIRAAHEALADRAPDYGTGSFPTITSGGCGAPLPPDEVLKRRAALVLLTDGEDTASDIQYADVLLASHQAERPVFAVAVGLAGGRTRRSRYVSFQAYRREANYGDSLQDQLAELSRVSGGHLITQRDIEDGYDEVLALLRGYYVLGYRTPTPIREGWNGVRVEVEGDYQVLTQPGVYRTSTDYAAMRSAMKIAAERLRGNPREALRMFEIAEQLAPELATPSFGRGVALERLGSLEAARDAYERALYLSPGAVEIRRRLAAISLTLADYPAAWLHAVRVRRAGYDASEILETLQRVSPTPDDFDARVRGPRVAVPKATVPDLDAQLALLPIWRKVAARLEQDLSITVVPAGSRADFVAALDLRELETRAPRRLDLRLDLLDIYQGETEDPRVEVDDIEDIEALDAALDDAVSEGLEWLRKRFARRR